VKKKVYKTYNILISKKLEFGNEIHIVKYEEDWWRVVALLFACQTLKPMHQKVVDNVFKIYKE
jgi:hypothetical protein